LTNLLIEAWTLLLSWADQQPVESFRRVYERFLVVFPSSGRHWRVYIEQGMTLLFCDCCFVLISKSLEMDEAIRDGSTQF
jgi:hypothetical protein